MKKRMGPIVVGVATVDELDPALPTALRLAESVGAILHVVHVHRADPLIPYRSLPVPAGLSPEYLRYEREKTESVLQQHCARFKPLPHGLVTRALVGSPHGELAAYARDQAAELLVIGATRRGRIWKSLLGTTAERVLRMASVPVLVLHQPFFRPVQRVLLTTDLSPLSGPLHERALDVVETLFDGNGLEVRSLMVLPGEGPYAMLDEMEAIGRAELEDFLADRNPRAYSVASRIRCGEPSLEINVEAEAWGADLIAMGTHGRSGVARFAFGSVAAATLRDATRNVLVIPATAPGVRAQPEAAVPAAG